MSKWGFQLYDHSKLKPVLYTQCDRCPEDALFMLVWRYRTRRGHTISQCANLCRVHAERCARMHNLPLNNPTTLALQKKANAAS